MSVNETELATLREKYIKLLETRESESLALIQEKEYNVSLRLAIANIPLDMKKAKSPTNQAIRKAKRLVTTSPSLKRKQESEPRQKRKYVRRKLEPVEQKQRTSVDSSSSSSSYSIGDDDDDDDADGEDSFISVTENEMNDDTRLSLKKVIQNMRGNKVKETLGASPKPPIIVSDTFQ